ncbi:MAG: 2-amino-4-hydroxy-6-hydroxymethyldihydropteridine diphosphokinase [Actinobacteria bacterium]|nr:2-amino-4-hydroxy-6-hydroxymethyldihydropteridine diphosphokinase [Cyanobacteriota bacterium]MCL5771614.1 2-amino-4-hydroxy-6-hydroxymethyldihydropteridine diphosphokinase [Actinomycetota bacterium]
MFKIFIKNLSLYGYHGVKPEEKEEGQYFVFNVGIIINKGSFNGIDNLSETVNYSEVIKIIKEINSSNKFNLLETLAEKICYKIFELSSLISKVKVKVEKINPPIDEKLDSVGVSFNLTLNKFNQKSQKSENYRIIYLSIGTNKGNKLENIKKALKMINESAVFEILKVSSIYETEPMYYKEQENFYNIVIKTAIKNSINPFVILGNIKNIEFEMGRENQIIKNGPRIIDIDILFIEGLNIDSDILKIPHPKLSERNFVLIPLSEIAPDFKINDMDINEYIKIKNFSDKVIKINHML